MSAGGQDRETPSHSVATLGREEPLQDSRSMVPPVRRGKQDGVAISCGLRKKELRSEDA